MTPSRLHNTLRVLKLWPFHLAEDAFLQQGPPTGNVFLYIHRKKQRHLRNARHTLDLAMPVSVRIIVVFVSHEEVRRLNSKCGWLSFTLNHHKMPKSIPYKGSYGPLFFNHIPASELS